MLKMDRRRIMMVLMLLNVALLVELAVPRRAAAVELNCGCSTNVVDCTSGTCVPVPCSPSLWQKLVS